MTQRAPFIGLVFAFALACGSNASKGSDVMRGTPGANLSIPPDATPSQVSAFANLRDATQRSWLWLEEPTLKTPMHLAADRTGTPALQPGTDAAATTVAFLETNKALFRMRAPSSELALERAHVDALGMTHTRFRQVVRGVPVAGREVYAHYDNAGRLASIDADYVADLDIAVTPSLSLEAAVARAKVALGGDSAGTDHGRLVIYAPEGAPSARLAYEARIRVTSSPRGDKPAIWAATIDATTGEILHKYDDLQTVQGQGIGILGAPETFEVSPADGGGFVLTDLSSDVEITTLTAERTKTAPGTFITSTSANSWDTDVTGAGAAVDAHVNAEKVFKYYKDHHGRSSIDGQGGAMLSTVHYGKAYDNAAWDGTGMLYGDGGDEFIPLSLALDVVGHEFTHGVTDSTSHLQYETQSGALNEAVSDMFGCFIEHATQPDPAKNWTIAESIMKQGGVLRDLTKPESVADPQPGHMTEFLKTQEDNGGVHTNSGIINNAGWLMTVGGVNPVSKIEVKYGIGWEKSEKIWYRADTTYFKETTNFGQAAQNILQAGKDLGLTDNELAIVDCAFKAVGVEQGDCLPITDPQATPQSTSPVSPGDPDGHSVSPTLPGGPAPGKNDAPLQPPPVTKKAVSVEEGGCNASGRASDGWSFGALLGLGLALVSRRRRP
jgi:Zn-dependent metalloprotease